MTRATDVVRRRQRATRHAFLSLAGPGLGLALVTAWVVTRGMALCWPQALSGTNCVVLLGAGLFCWIVPATAAATGGWQWVRTVCGLDCFLRQRHPAAEPTRELSPPGCCEPAVTVVDDAALWALTHGFIRPRIAVSSGLVATLSPDELAAVLAHEEHHRRCREPLRLALARVARATLWFLPAAGRLLDSYTAAAELAADAHALDRVGRRPLAGALWKLRGTRRPVAAVSFAPTPTLLRLRVEQIERFPEATPGTHPRTLDVLATVGAAAAAAAWSLLCLRI